ncbi:MAG: DUF4198 domain-containing protein [Betaproteobacteria bacterium]|nr:DUF4198 domain-containing protein [Betaproteobacteria bacterium]
MLRSRKSQGVIQLRQAIPWLSLLTGLACPSSAAGHDFWVQPREFWLQSAGTTTLTLQVGHGPDRQRSQIPAGRITRFAALASNGAMLDLRGALHLGGPLDDGRLAFSLPGTYVLMLETDNRARSQLPASRFNDYLAVEGLTPALEHRVRMHRTEATGSENYSRCAKSLMQVGPPGKESQAQITKAQGLHLEIVPEESPYAEPRPTVFPIRVNYEGRPLPGALVKLTNLEHDETPLEMHRTDQQGRVRFSMPKAGAWLLNVIWTRPLTHSEDAEFETVFSSLSFGFPAKALENR